MSAVYVVLEQFTDDVAVRADMSEISAQYDQIVVTVGDGVHIRLTRQAAEVLADGVVSALAVLEDLRAKADAVTTAETAVVTACTVVTEVRHDRDHPPE